jgi:hypothetical protein
MQVSCQGLCVLSTVRRISGSDAVWQCGENCVPPCMNHICHRWWRGTCCKSTGKSFTKKRWFTAPLSLLGKAVGPKNGSPNMPSKTLMENRCWYLDATVMWGLSSTKTSIVKVHNTVPCESHLISKQDVSCKLCVYKKSHPCTRIRRSEGLNSLDVVWVKWLFMDNSPDKWNAGTLSSWNSSHIGSGVFCSPHYVNFRIGSSNWSRPPTIRRPWSKVTRFVQLLVEFGE